MREKATKIGFQHIYLSSKTCLKLTPICSKTVMSTNFREILYLSRNWPKQANIIQRLQEKYISNPLAFCMVLDTCTGCSVFKFMRNRLSSAHHVNTVWFVDQSKQTPPWRNYNSVLLDITTSGNTTHKLKNGSFCIGLLNQFFKIF